MREKYPIEKPTSDNQRLQRELESWCYNSHCWTEPLNSISECIWCGMKINGHHGVNLTEMPLCIFNPKVWELLKKEESKVWPDQC